MQRIDNELGRESRGILKLNVRAKMKFPARKLVIVLPGKRERGYRPSEPVKCDQAIGDQIQETFLRNPVGDASLLLRRVERSDAALQIDS